jgi:hypothetical protein
MSDPRVFNNVTPEAFGRIKNKSRQEHGTVYDPADGERGTATTKTWVGAVVVGFAFDRAAKTLTYTLVSKPMVAPESKIWSGIESTVSSCR